MSEHLSDQTVESYRKRLMSPAELLNTDDHIGACSVCRQRLFNAEELAGKTFSLRMALNTPDIIPDHPDYQTLPAYVDDQLEAADREIVKCHVEICQNCLRYFRDRF